ETKGLLKDAGKKLPLVDKVVVHIMVESQPQWLKFQKGELDNIAIPKDNFQSAVTPDNTIHPDLAKKGMVLTSEPALDVTFVGFNNEHPLFKNNAKLRRAMAM